jgi:signal recognition particle receptor subunit beta
MLRFGRLALSGDTVLQLFGIDWQDLTHFPWETVASGLIGAIVLVDAGATDSAGVVAPVLRLLTEQGDLPVVLAAEHLRAGDEAGVAPLEVAAGAAGVAVMPLRSGDRRSALDALITLMRASIGEVEAGADGGVDAPTAAPPGAVL